MERVLWIGSIALVGGLVGLRRGWRRQAADAAGCLVALGLAYWQHPQLVPAVRAIWGDLAGAARPVALGYLFAVLYALVQVLLPLFGRENLGRDWPPGGSRNGNADERHVPDAQRASERRWLGGVIGALQAGMVAALSIVMLSRL